MGQPICVANIVEEGKLGGPQVRIAKVAAVLRPRAETTVIMPLENSEHFQKLCESLRVVYRVLPLTRITKEWRVAMRYVLFSGIEILRLTSFLRRGEFDLVHVSGGSWQYKGVIAGKLAGKKVLWHLNDTAMPDFIRRIFTAISGLADGFIFASERSRAYYLPLLRVNKPEFVVPAPVNTSQFDPKGSYPGDEDLIKKWSGKFVIGTVGNINPIKGLEGFIRAAALVNVKLDNTNFVIVGPVFKNQQRYFNTLQRLCNELGVFNIEFVGGRSDVRPLLKRFDIYMCSSRAESSPIAVWEAMSMGKPIISTDVGDVPLYVCDDYNGFIVEVDDSAAIAKRIGSLIADTALRNKMGQRSREVVIQHLDIKQCAERHLDAYKQVAGVAC